MAWMMIETVMEKLVQDETGDAANRVGHDLSVPYYAAEKPMIALRRSSNSITDLSFPAKAIF